MLKTIEVVFDGNTFVPTEPVEYPPGTKLNLALPESGTVVQCRLVSSHPRPLTDEGKKEWEELRRQWEVIPPEFSTVEEAISYSRGRPWPKYEPMPESDEADGANDDGKEGHH